MGLGVSGDWGVCWVRYSLGIYAGSAHSDRFVVCAGDIVDGWEVCTGVGEVVGVRGGVVIIGKVVVVCGGRFRLKR